jgi:hypothetical protein
MPDLPATMEKRTTLEKAQAYRRRVIELMDIAQCLRNENSRTILQQTAQEFHRLAEALEKA